LTLLQEKEDAKNMKSKMREKVRPKLGKIDIDYQKLHDAFFKWQTKPKMTQHGDLYYEGETWICLCRTFLLARKYQTMFLCAIANLVLSSRYRKNGKTMSQLEYFC
jgi:hypothetical protein